MHSVGAHLVLGRPRQLLPGHPPVRGNTTNIEGRAFSIVGLSSADVFRAVDGSVYIQMVIPHGKSTDAADILRQRTIDNCRCIGAKGNIAGDPRETPGRSAVPEI